MAVICFSLLAASLMMLTAFGPIVQALAEDIAPDYSYTVPPASVDSSLSPDQIPPWFDPNSSESGVNYVPPHQTTSYYTDSGPTLTRAAQFVRPVLFNENAEAYSYETVFGIYSCSKNNPSILTLSDRAGGLLAASQFAVESDHQLCLGKAELVRANQSEFVTRQAVTYEGHDVGYLIVETVFFNSREPKITAWLNLTCPADTLSFFISWNVNMVGSSIRIENQTLDALSTLSPQSNLAGTFALESGIAGKNGSWNAKCRIDWSDAGCGDLMIQAASGGFEAKVSFPSGMAFVDPTIVGSSYYRYSTSGSPFRNLVYYDGVYWLFFADYLGLFYVHSSDGGQSWSSPLGVPASLYLSETPNSFDVAIQGNRIGISMAENFSYPYHRCYFIEGRISGSVISWGSLISFGSMFGVASGSPPNWIGGLALTSDGASYVCYSNVTNTGDPYNSINITTKKKGPRDSVFVEFWNPFPEALYGYPGLATTVQPRFVSLSDGNLALVVVWDTVSGINHLTTLYWDVYFPAIGSWESSSYRVWCNLPHIFDSRAFSACPGKTNETNLVIERNDTSLVYVRLSGKSASSQQLGQSGSHPSISIDQAGGLHVHFLKYESQSNKIYCMHTIPGGSSWSAANRSFEDAVDNQNCMSVGERFVARNFLSYVDWNATYSFDVKFGATPLPADFVGPYGDPWSEAGVGRDGPFDAGITDVISPGNGLLYVFQTDFVIPGRGMDMVASRFFATPQYFVKNESSFYVPYLYDRFPYSDMGDGWQLNLPWIEDGFIHLWGGTRIRIEWDGNFFNSTKGQPFTLAKKNFGGVVCIWLDLQDGMRVNFTADGRPSEIYANRVLDVSSPDVVLSYEPTPGGGQLTRMTDYLGRSINFTYAEGKVGSIEYKGKYVNFTYTAGLLTGTSDLLGRTTSYVYRTSGNPSMLIQTVVLPTGGSYDYEYSSISVGSEAIAKVVSRKDEDPYTKANDGHTVFYTYTALDGVIKNTQVQECSGIPRLKGMTEYNFDSEARSTVVTYFSTPNGFWSHLVPMKRTVSWYSLDGKVTRTESYDDFRMSPDVAVSAADNKGNTIYSMDPMGHEAFSSYANTSTRSAFLRPGNLNLTSSGKVFFDDFNDWVADGWTGTAARSVDNWLGDYELDPSCKVTASYGPSYAAVELCPGGTGLSEVILDCIVMVKSSDSDSSFVLSTGLSDAMTGARFAYNDTLGGNRIHYLAPNGGWEATSAVYRSDVAYRLTLCVEKRWSYTYRCTLYLNGGVISQVDREFQDLMNYFRVDVAYAAGSQNCVVIDNVKLFRSWDITITGLELGQFVELFGGAGNLLFRTKCFEEDWGASMSYDPSIIPAPYGAFVIKNETGVVELIDSSREVWGGDTYEYSRPEFLKCAIRKTSSGFDSWTGMIMDDHIPRGCFFNSTLNFNFDFEPELVISGATYHHDEFSPGELSHSYWAEVGTLPTEGVPKVDGDDFFINFVYLPSQSYPITIGVRYYYNYVDAGDYQHGWWSMAYWGPDAIQSVHAQKRSMGDLPVRPNQWLMLVTKASDIWWPRDSSEGAKYVEGMQFFHFGGDPYWDHSVYSSYPDFGKVNVTGLVQGMKVELRRPNGTAVCSATVGSGQTKAFLDLYGAGVRCFPLAGYFVVYESSSPSAKVLYESPVFTDIYAHDEYAFSASSSPFYVNSAIPTGFSKLAAGTMQYVDRSKSVSMETYMKYGFEVGSQRAKTWLLSEQKTKNGSRWLTTSYEYDAYGNVVRATDPTRNSTLSYLYEKEGTYLNSTWMNVGVQTISTQYSYYDNGLLRSEADSRGNKTIYEYDKAGRITRTTYPKVNGRLVSERYEYDDVNLVERFFDPNGTQTNTWYDKYGRVTFIQRLDKYGTSYSSRTYFYAWNGKVKKIGNVGQSLVQLEYDYLGRVTKGTNADGTYVTTVFDDKNNTVTIYDEMSARTDLVYDANDRLIQSVQYLGSAKLYTNMTYDGIGNLLSVTDPNGTWTANQYDDMGRLVRTDFSYGGYVQLGYDNASRILWTRTEAGKTIAYKYDVAGRLVDWSAGSNDKVTYTYDWNSNVKVATRIAPPGTGTTITTKYDYDSWNRVLNETTSLDGTNYRVSYTYDNRSNVLSIEIFTGATSKYKLKYGYDEFNRLLRTWDNVSGSLFLLASFSYNDLDQIISVTYGNDLVTAYDLNARRGWINGITTSNGATPLLSLTYARDSIGRITSLSNLGRTFVYDSVGKLRYANDTAHSFHGTFEFSYDRCGNRLAQTWGSTTTTYRYDQSGRLLSNTTNGKTTSYQYINGDTGLLWKRTTGSETWEFAYDANDMLISSKKGSSTLEQYWYDALGRRVKSITGTGSQAVTEYTVYSGASPVYIDDRKTKIQTLHVTANGMHIAKKTSEKNTPRYYYHCDSLGTVRLVTDKNKAPVFDADYLPFGKTAIANGTESFMFIDARQTKSSGLIHFGARYYDPNSGRFTSPDSVLGSLSKPSSLNRWAYCMNDPIDRVDKDGQWSFWKSITNIGSSIYDAGRNIVGNVIEAVVDVTRDYVDAVIDLGKRIIDAGEKFIEDVKDACDWVVDTAVSTAKAIQKAWDSLDSGLKQWIIMGISMAVSFIPLVGPIISCIMDGTFVDMFNALMKGDWATVGMCAMGFVPGLKAFKGLKVLGKSEGLLGKIGKYGALRKEVKAAGLSKELKCHHLIEKRFAKTLGVNPNKMPAVVLTDAQHGAFTKAWGNAVKYGDRGILNTGTADLADLKRAVGDIYKNDPDLLEVSLGYLNKFG